MTILDAGISHQAIELYELCLKHDVVIATAESCTGGLIAACLTEIAGSSAMFDRGFVTYSNEAKVEMLGVKPATLDEFRAVSRQTALEMAAGALENSNASLSIAVTGIAGPSGGTPEKPVGLVHIAVNLDGEALHQECHFGPLTRHEIRSETVRRALEMSAEAVRKRYGAQK